MLSDTASAVRGGRKNLVVMVRTCFGFGAAMLIHHAFMVHAAMVHVPVIHLLTSSRFLRLCGLLVRYRFGSLCLSSMLFVLTVIFTGQQHRSMQGSQKAQHGSAANQGLPLHKSAHQISPLLIHTNFTEHAHFHVE